MSNVIRVIIKVVLPLLVLVAAAMGARGLVMSRPEAPKGEQPDRALLVKTQTVERSPLRIDVRAQGNVQAAREVRITAQVAGEVKSIHDNLVPGGFIPKGERLVRIDATDYQLAVQQQKLNVENATANLDQEKGRQIIAAREWELFKQTNGGKNSDPSLALRKPQLKQAEISIKLAEAQLKQAKVNLGRTSVKAPFNAIVKSESVEVGQLVNSQTAIATLTGTDTYWVRASVPMDQLSRIAIPGINAGEGEGSVATIEQDMGAGVATYEARVIRLLSELDQVGRMAQLILEVKDPLGLDKSKENKGNMARVPLLIGSYVTVVFAGSQQRELIEVPRRAIHNGNQVWVMTPEKTLAVREVVIVSGQPDRVLVGDGLKDGDEIILSQIGTPVEGMKLKREGSASDKGGEQ